MVYPSNITLNLNTRYVLPIPTAQQGDTARVLTFNILDKGVPFSLQGKTVRAKILKPDNTKCYNDLTITNATNGECTLNLTNQILAVAGKVNCQLEIKEGEELLSTIIFSIDVEPSIDVTGAVESSNEFTALQNGLTKLDEWDKYFHETSGAIEEKYTTRLNAVESSLEDIAINVKSFGAIGDWSSHKLNSIFLSLEEAKKVYPCASSLDDEIDWCAIQTALNNSTNVYIPYGGYTINKTLLLKDGTILKGASNKASQILYSPKDKILFDTNAENSYITISDMAISNTNLSPSGTCGTDNTAIAINYKSCTYGHFNNLKIYGFDVGIDFGSNSWVQNVYNCTIQNCNKAIKGGGEFNSIAINKVIALFCDYGFYIGGGRTISITDCCVERNNIGIYKYDNGSIEISKTYFEANNVYDVQIIIGNTSPEFVDISECSFFKRSGNCIAYHLLPNYTINIKNNYFKKVDDSIEKVYALQRTNSSKVIVNFENNGLINAEQAEKDTLNYCSNVNQRSIYNPSTLIYQFVVPVENTIDLDKLLKQGITCFRFVVANDNIILKLPNLKDDIQQSFSFFYTSTGTGKVGFDTSNNCNVVSNPDRINAQCRQQTLVVSRVTSNGTCEWILLD